MPSNMTKRKKDKHLPRNVRRKHGAIYYVKRYKDENGKRIQKWLKLGYSESEALGNYGKIVITHTVCKTMNDLFDRYLLEVAPHKALDTYKKDAQRMKKLKEVFGEMPPTTLKPIHVYGFMDRRAKKSIHQANGEKSLLSAVMTQAVKWGVVEENVCLQIKPLPIDKKVTRYVEDLEYSAVYNIANPVIKIGMKLALVTGLRQADILKIKLSDLKDNGLYVKTQKTGGEKLFSWTPELREAISMAKALQRKIKGFYLLGNRDGQKYTRHGFSAMYKRTVNKAFADGVIKEKFNFHDLRRKAATDAERLYGREYARKLLGHSTQKMTGKYIGGVEVIEPLQFQKAKNE